MLLHVEVVGTSLGARRGRGGVPNAECLHRLSRFVLGTEITQLFRFTLNLYFGTPFDSLLTALPGVFVLAYTLVLARTTGSRGTLSSNLDV